jgi:hypothetical protein
VIVSADLYDNGQTNEGRAYVYHGSASGLSLTANWTAESDQAGAFFGVSVAAAGDVNGDGYSDVIVGADEFDNGQFSEGRAFVYHGSASGLSLTANWTAESDQASASFGYSVASAGAAPAVRGQAIRHGVQRHGAGDRPGVQHRRAGGRAAARYRSTWCLRD